MTPWLVVLTEPQQEIPIVWRLHLLGVEMFTPVIRRRIRTGRIRHGHAITRLVARPMFPSYGFVRKTEIENSDQLTQVRGVRDLLRASNHAPVTLPHSAVLAIFGKQQEIQQDFLASQRQRRFQSNFHAGDRVRVDDGGIYSGLVAAVDRIDAKGRVEVLFGMIRHTLPPTMVVAA
jgi:transcription antitermination factor NusG